jgi:ribonuclease HI
MALLAKQGWRIIQNPDSLVGRIYKEKYFRHSTFLDSDIGSNPSYAWRSIWSAKPLLQKGLVWRVGDGKQIKIWKDKWIPTPTSYMIQSPHRVLDLEARVSSLINMDTNWWNIPLIREVFNREEADTIYGLALCLGRQEDKQIWVGSKNGLFTVRSAYHLAKASDEADRGCCSSPDRTQGLWKVVWSLKVSRVVQHFLWRACNDILPTKEKLHKRGITADALCPICGLETETVNHILWSCESAKDVWSECCRAIQKCSIAEGEFFSLFETLADKLNEEELQMMAGVARQIWLRRNAVVFEGEFLTPGVLVKQASDQLEAWRKAEESRRLGNPSCSRPRSMGWQRPPFGVIKLNWDAAINKVTRRMGVGIVARDAGGAVVAVRCASRPHITDPATAEAMAVWMLADFSITLGHTQIIAEGDSLEVVGALRRDGECCNSYGHIVEEAKALFNTMESWSVKHVGRENNSAAHHLAQYAATREDDQTWVSDFPDFLQSFVNFDLDRS